MGSHPVAGKQRDPKPHVHNSGWVQAPGAEILKDETRWNRELKPYVSGVIGHFRDDPRVLMWDLMNEPDNENGSYKAQELPNKGEVAFRLLREEWAWARSAKPIAALDQWGMARRLVERRQTERNGKPAATELRRHHLSQLRTARRNEAPDSSRCGDWAARSSARNIWRGRAGVRSPQSCRC